MTTLNVPLQLRRGSQASHPTVMLSGEVYVCLDTGLLFCGTGSGVIQVGGGSAPSGAANLVYATPNGSSGSASLRALVAADIPQLAYSSLSGLPTIPSSFAWNVEGNATGNLTLANAGFTTTFNQTSSVPWLWANTTIATGLTTNASPLLELAANYWTGAASVQDLWTIGSSLLAGTNGASTLAFTHNGSTGTAQVQVPSLSIQAVSGNHFLRFGANSANTYLYSDGSTFIAGQVANTLAFQITSTQSIFYGQLLAGSTTFPLTCGGTTGVGGLSIQGPGTENLGILWTASTKTLALLNAVGTATSTWAADAGIVFTSPSVFGSTVSASNVACSNNAVPASGSCTHFFSVGTQCLSCSVNSFIGWGAQNNAASKAFDISLSRLSSGVLAIGNGVAADFTGALQLGALSQVNGTIATSLTTNASPLHTFSANYWTGAASAQDLWTLQSTLAAGTNGASILAFTHTGSTSNASGVKVPRLILDIGGGTAGALYFINGNTTLGVTSGYLRMVNAGAGNGFSLDLNGNSLFGTLCGFSTNTFTASDTGISRLAAASLAIGNGTASDVSGGLTLTTVTQQSANAAQWVKGQASELLTLSTVGLTTDTAGLLLPANSIIEAVVCRVTTTITTTTNWAVGDATIAARFSAANTTLIAGTTSVGIQQCDQTGTSGPKQVAASKVRITCTGSNPGAGIVRITVFYRQFVAPTS